MWDRQLPGADAALSIRPLAQQAAERCVDGSQARGKGKRKEKKNTQKKNNKHGQRLQSKKKNNNNNKDGLLEVGVKVHLLWLEDPRSRVSRAAERAPQLFFTPRGLKGVSTH